MREYKDKEKKIRMKEEERRKMLGMTMNDNKSEKEEEKSITVSPSGTKNAFNISKNETVNDLGKSKMTVKGVTLLSKD